MSPLIGVMIILAFMFSNFAIGMTILYKTIKAGKQQ